MKKKPSKRCGSKGKVKASVACPTSCKVKGCKEVATVAPSPTPVVDLADVDCHALERSECGLQGEAGPATAPCCSGQGGKRVLQYHFNSGV